MNTLWILLFWPKDSLLQNLGSEKPQGWSGKNYKRLVLLEFIPRYFSKTTCDQEKRLWYSNSAFFNYPRLDTLVPVICLVSICVIGQHMTFFQDEEKEKTKTKRAWTGPGIFFCRAPNIFFLLFFASILHLRTIRSQNFEIFWLFIPKFMNFSA